MNKKILQGSFIIGALAVISVAAIQNQSTVKPMDKTTPSLTANTIDQETKKEIIEAYGKTPIGFEKNIGQTDAQVAFLTRGQGYTLFLTPSEAVLKMQRTETEIPSSNITNNQTSPIVLRMQLLEANAAPILEGLDTMTSKSNYFIGDQKQTDISQYKKVKYNDIYPGIDLVYYGNQQQLEYDFIVAPEANPDAIQISFDGADQIEIAKDGQLNIHSSDEVVKLLKPIVYQNIDGQKAFIEGNYTLTDNHVGFELAAYDTSKALVIDPILVYSTYLDGNAHGGLTGVAIDDAGHAYVVGRTVATNFPTTSGAYQTTGGGVWYATISKLDPTGTSLIYSTYLGGNNATMGEAIAVDSAGNAYVAGGTAASTYPTTTGAIQAVNNAGWGKYNGFITKLNATGSALLYSTHLGGSTGGIFSDIAIDGADNAYVTGRTQSVDFPVSNGAIQTNYGGGVYDIVVAKINATATQLIYSSYIGGAGHDDPRGIAVDAAGNAVISGFTASPLYPTTAGAYQEIYGGGQYDAVVSKLNADGTAFIYSTFLGGTGFDRSFDIALDGAGNAYLSGDTASNDFPVTPNAYQTSFTVPTVYTFVTKLNPSGSGLIYSTYVGMGLGYAIAIDTSGRAYVAGLSRNLPASADAMQKVVGGNFDAFLARLSTTGSTLEYATYLGGSGYDTATAIAADAFGNVYMAGATSSFDFPLLNPIQPAYGGDVRDGFIAKMITIDADGDGVPDALDAFPNDPAASVDSDGDGYPDSWNANATPSQIASSFLVLDAFPNDPNHWLADTTAPVITIPTVTIDPVSGAVNLGVVTANDNVDGAVLVNNDAPAVFPVGITIVVTYSATDSSRNIATATQTVTVPVLDVTTLTPAQIARLSPAQVVSLTPVEVSLVIASLTPTQVAALTPVQVAAFTPSEITVVIALLTPAQVAVLTPIQVAALTPSEITVVIALLSPPQVTALIPIQIVALTPSEITVVIALLTPAQIAALTPVQVAALTSVQVNVVIGLLTPTQVAALAPVQIAALSPADVTVVIGLLTPSQVAALTPVQVAALTPAQVNVVVILLTPAQVAVLTPVQVAAMSPVVITALGLDGEESESDEYEGRYEDDDSDHNDDEYTDREKEKSEKSEKDEKKDKKKKGKKSERS